MRNKQYFIVFTMLCMAAYLPLQAQTVTNVAAEQVGKTVEISYTLDKSTEISIEYSTDGTHYTKLKNVSGDVGRNVQAGKKKIIWDALAEIGEFVKDNVRFKIICGITSVTDCQGHTYPVVKIGEQYWMAENLQCTKYDTQSERAGQMLQTLSTYGTYAPYYTDGRYANTKYSENLTNEQRKHLGLLYNWAAAMGYTEFQARHPNYYNCIRQGICPNGWHLPNREDWNILANAIGGAPNTYTNGYVNNYPNVVSKLRSRSGWYNGHNGTDDYGFSGLPAGTASGKHVSLVGDCGAFWMSGADDSNNGYKYSLIYSYLGEICGRFYAYSVRCIKNE